MSVTGAAAKIPAGRAAITFARAAENLVGLAERTDAMLLMVDAQIVTTLLAPGAGVVGGRTSLILVRMDTHARAMGEDEVLGALPALVFCFVNPAALVNGTLLT